MTKKPEELVECDRCRKPTPKYRRWYIGDYASLIEDNEMSFYCRACYAAYVQREYLNVMAETLEGRVTTVKNGRMCSSLRRTDMTLCQHPDCEQEGMYISRICGGPIVCKEHTEWGFEMLREWSELSDEQYSLIDFMSDKIRGNI